MTIDKSILYVVSAEVFALEESQMRKETNAVGAFLYALVMAQDALEAGKMVKEALEEEFYRVERIEEIFDSDNFEFEEDDETDYELLKTEAVESEEVVYGTFFLWEN